MIENNNSRLVACAKMQHNHSAKLCVVLHVTCSNVAKLLRFEGGKIDEAESMELVGDWRCCVSSETLHLAAWNQ